MSTEEPKKKIRYWKDQEPPKPDTLFTDPLFPPNRNSLLGLDSSGKIIDPQVHKDYKNEITNFENITFARPNEIFGNEYKLFSGKIEVNDIKQGALGDCYFLTALGNICKFPGLIMKIFKTKEINKYGYYELFLRIDGKPTMLIIDDYIPVFKDTKKPCFAKPNGKELWVMLLEKAWAKINGGYMNTIGGQVHEPFEVLTGFGSRVYNLSDKDENSKMEILEEMKEADLSNCFISCGTKKDEELEKYGLVPSHAYSILGLNVVETIYKNKITLLRLRNPWSHKEWIGDWSDNSILWDEKTKSQVNYKKSDDGIFYMSDTDFFKYFSSLQICYMLYDSTSIRYTIEGEENLKNGIVFNIEAENDGLLSITVARKSWRAHREIRNKELPTHISVVSYNTNPENKLKTFSDYSGTSKSNETCNLNKKIKKGNYLIYIYRDSDNAEFPVEDKLDIKIVCSANFKHAQMNYDLREYGFPLLQNIILQSVLEEQKYDFNSSSPLFTKASSMKNNGLGYLIIYQTTPGNFYELKNNTYYLVNMFLLSPYNQKNEKFVTTVFPSGKFIVLLGLRSNDSKTYWFDLDSKLTRKNAKVALNFQDNDIDLDLYTNINNDIKNGTFMKRKTQSLENISIDINFDVNYIELPELEKKYPAYLKLLNEIPNNNDNNNLKWGTIRVNNSLLQNYLYIGQILNDQKEGKGIFIDSSFVFVGEYKNNLKNGVGITYQNQKNLQKLNKYNYINDNKEDKGILYYKDGSRYEGMIKFGLPEGKGTFYFKQGDKYEGDFNLGKRDGKGTYFHNDGNRYEGEWKKGLRDGKGVYYYKNGDKYEGDWKNDLRDGKGILYQKNGNKYEGDWKNDLKEGKGKLYTSGGEIYEGSFKNNVREGKGICYAKSGLRYEGDWKNHLMDGKGAVYYANGDREIGDFSKGKQIGIHAYLYANGKVEAKNHGA